MRLLTVILFTMLMASCSDNTTPGADMTPVADTGTNDKPSVDAPSVDKSSAAEQSTTSGKATDLKLMLHDNLVKAALSTMSVVGKEATDWDLYITHGDPVDKLPHIELGPGVTAQNLGNATPFHGVTTAPTSGYASDTPPTTYVIGSSWRSGGSGTAGFVMTKNIYAIKLADGTYAKIEVLSAKGGEVHILAYRQSKAGDTNLTTTP